MEMKMKNRSHEYDHGDIIVLVLYNSLVLYLHIQHMNTNIVNKKTSQKKCSAKKCFKNFAKFPRKYLCLSLFLINLQAKACNFI